MKEIDLHGVRHREVSDLITRSCIEEDVPFVVITGKSDQMKRIVSAVVKTFGLSARDAIDNPGRIVVDV